VEKRLDRSGPGQRRNRGLCGPVLTVERPSQEDRHGRAFPLEAPSDGEALLNLQARAQTGPALLAIGIDGRLVSHAVVPPGGPIPVAVSLGRVPRGSHRATVEPVDGFASAAIDPDPAFTLADVDHPASVVLRHAPILFGRTAGVPGDPYQNVHTDVPLLAWHVERSMGPHRLLEYSVLWSHEDGGTDGPTLMARWGRTTDIEWVYRVRVDHRGRRIPGSAEYQGPGHVSRAFAGRYELDHPLLQVCTPNNMVSDRVDGVLRFALAADTSMLPDRAREAMMELHPWTRRVAASEVTAAGLTDPGSAARSPTLGHPRRYLYLELATHRLPATTRPAGLAIGIRVAGDPTVYRSDHGLLDRSITRSGPVSAAVKLPAGTTVADVDQVLAIRVSAPGACDHILVDGVTRGFLLTETLAPGPSLSGRGRQVVLTPHRASAVVWSRELEPAATSEAGERRCGAVGPGRPERVRA
jgi:hypothetical protein